MSNKDGDKLNFVTDKSFELAVKKAKRKQILRNFIISLISAFLLIWALYFGATYNLKKKLEDYSQSMFYSQIKGANIEMTSIVNSYGFLHAVTHTTVEKTMGDRRITWDILEQEVPAIGKGKYINESNSLGTQYSDELKRQVKYNSYNGEREIQFFNPQHDTKGLPQELNLINKLDNNTLIEVALSFDKSYSLNEIEDILGSDNVNWLWVETQQEESKKSIVGSSASGFQINEPGYEAQGELFLNNLIILSENGKYKKEAEELLKGLKGDLSPTVNDVKASGAVVTGTPNQLRKFQEIGIVKASTLGATIDRY